MKSMIDGKRRENAEDVTRHSHAKHYQNASTGTTCWSRVFGVSFFSCKVRQIINLAALSLRLGCYSYRGRGRGYFLFFQASIAYHSGSSRGRRRVVRTPCDFAKTPGPGSPSNVGEIPTEPTYMESTWDLRLTNQSKPLPAVME